MAIATNGGHVSRAIDFYESENKYFIIGGTKEWSTKADDGTEIADTPTVEDFKLIDVVALKKVEQTHLVIKVVPKADEDTSNYIRYRDDYYKKIPKSIATTVTEVVLKEEGKSKHTMSVSDNSPFSIGDKIRIQYGNLADSNYYDTTITGKTGSTSITVADAFPDTIYDKATIEGGALIEGARYVYVDCTLSYDTFPMTTYRQIGLCTRVVPHANVTDTDILRSKTWSNKEYNDYTSLGILEILDNRRPNVRSSDQQEHLSLIIEF